MTNYKLRKEACILLERERLEKRGIATMQAETLAIHSVNRTLWILRNKAGMTRWQALDVLEARQVEKRTRLKTVYFYTMNKYDTQLQYNDRTTDTIVLQEALTHYLLNQTKKRQPYLWLARQSRRVGLKPRELIELIDRLRYKQSCDTIELIDRIDSNTTTIDKWKARSIQQIDLVGQLERLVKAYQGKRILVYGGLLFTTINFTELYNLVYLAYGKPDDKVLLSVYQLYCDGDIHYKEDIVKDYVNRIKNMNN